MVFLVFWVHLIVSLTSVGFFVTIFKFELLFKFVLVYMSLRKIFKLFKRHHLRSLVGKPLEDLCVLRDLLLHAKCDKYFMLLGKHAVYVKYTCRPTKISFSFHLVISMLKTTYIICRLLHKRTEWECKRVFWSPGQTLSTLFNIV